MKLETRIEGKKAIKAASEAARSVGNLLRRHLSEKKKADSVTQHDIKLELDVRCQKLIERTLRSAFPNVALLGEEGISGDQAAEHRWVVDPIDGTVNFAYGIPHCCVSIALQTRGAKGEAASYPDGYDTVAGIVYDPFCDELWTALKGQEAKLNGKPVRVSERAKLNECIISIGFSKSKESLDGTLPYFNQLIPRVRKVRMMGAAALGLAYVATGRFDAYIESGIRLWDIAAGGLLIECAGGEFFRKAIAGEHAYMMVANNGRLRKELRFPS
jgi:myo-inositol-1(or 4)-monophosphatase